MRRLTATVILRHPETGDPAPLLAGTVIPEWAIAQVDDSLLEGLDPVAPEPSGSTAATEPTDGEETGGQEQEEGQVDADESGAEEPTPPVVEPETSGATAVTAPSDGDQADDGAPVELAEEPVDGMAVVEDSEAATIAPRRSRTRR